MAVAKKDRVLSSDGDKEIRLRGYREIVFVRCVACGEFVEDFGLMSTSEGAVCVTGARRVSRFDGEWWVFVGSVPEAMKLGSIVCDECVVSLVERGIVRKI